MVKSIIDEVSSKAFGQSVLKSISPGQQIVKIFNDELVTVHFDVYEHDKSVGFNGYVKLTSIIDQSGDDIIKELEKYEIESIESDLYDEYL